MIRTRPSSGFTLIELILVMAIMATVMALAAPQLTRWKKGGKLRNAADEFIAATRWARSKAAADGAMYAVAIDKQSGTYRVQMKTGQEYGEAQGQFRAAPPLPEGVKIESTAELIEFYPTGRVDTATVKFTAEDGDSISVECTTPAGDFATVMTTS